MSLFSVQIQAVAQLLKSGSPVKSIDLGNTCISDDGAQAYGLMGWARRISDKVLVEVAPFRHRALHCDATTATTHSLVLQQGKQEDDRTSSS